jgi:hypothetical protein
MRRKHYTNYDGKSVFVFASENGFIYGTKSGWFMTKKKNKQCVSVMVFSAENPNSVRLSFIKYSILCISFLLQNFGKRKN